jgi:AraC-like DNA-binding protein
MDTEKVLAYLAANPDRKVFRAEVAALTGKTIRRFDLEFVRAFGESFHRYEQKRRVHALAHMLIEHPSLTHREAAKLCGWEKYRAAREAWDLHMVVSLRGWRPHVLGCALNQLPTDWLTNVISQSVTRTGSDVRDYPGDCGRHEHHGQEPCICPDK